ncbi:hypothetical protein V757_01025 [Pelistega indica]|uniref:tRNA_anti-like n=1 Tax=Pelistega indica TaxID=1414851 RepID=V8G9C0_9BURK|nr:hypothetical protein [Pelistega indica]ETD72990.1 hypothetical protein V757_01025 [Pelistega indica]
MKKVLLSTLLLVFSNQAISDEIKYLPSERELALTKILLSDDLLSYMDGGETAFGDFYKKDKRFDYSFETDAEEILKTYDQNEIRGDKKYKGKNIFVSGIVEKISSDFKDEPVVSFKSKEKYTVNKVQASFRPDELDKVVDLNKGQKISLLCVGGGEVAGSPVLKDCYFFDKKDEEKLIKEAVDEYMQQINKLVEDDVSNVPEQLREVVFASAVFYKATGGLNACKTEVNEKCFNASTKSLTKEKHRKIAKENG